MPDPSNPSSLRAFGRVLPYMARCRRTLALGAVALLLANYLDVKALVLLGRAIDALGADHAAGGDAAAVARRALAIGLGTVALVVVAGAFFRFWMRWLIIGVSREVESNLRNDLFARLQSLSASFFNRYPTGDLMARSTSDIESVRMVIGPALMYVSGTLTLIPFSVFQMIKISGPLTAATWAPLLLIAPMFYFFSSRIHKRFTDAQGTLSDITTRVQETLAGMRVIKAYAREEQEAERFETLSRRYVEQNIRLTRLESLFMPMMGVVVNLTVLTLLWAGGLLIARGRGTAGGISQGNLISFYVLLTANIWPLAAVGWVFSLLQRGSASMVRLDEIFEIKPDVTEPALAAKAEGNGHASIAEPPPRGGRVETRNLTFAYPGAERPALVDLSFTMPPGTALGLTGPVGCGKSTLAALLSRRYNPERGTLIIDGRDILDWPLKDYRARVGVVDQEPFLFSDTIRANICYGLPEENAAIAERASEIAQFAKEVEGFPQGYETLLGERGINLSGGQRQRCALARALAIDPEILILDDALAAVDTHTEEEILRGLRGFMTARTTIVISHRITAVSIADYILYLEEGRVVEEGTHEELMAQGGRYFDLARKQQLAEEIEATA